MVISALSFKGPLKIFYNFLIFKLKNTNAAELKNRDTQRAG